MPKLSQRLASSRNASLIFRMGNLFVAISAPPKRCDDSQRSDHPAMTIILSKDWPRCVGIGGRDESESVAAINRNRWPPCLGMRRWLGKFSTLSPSDLLRGPFSLL